MTAEPAKITLTTADLLLLKDSLQWLRSEYLLLSDQIRIDGATAVATWPYTSGLTDEHLALVLENGQLADRLSQTVTCKSKDRHYCGLQDIESRIQQPGVSGFLIKIHATLHCKMDGDKRFTGLKTGEPYLGPLTELIALNAVALLCHKLLGIQHLFLELAYDIVTMNAHLSQIIGPVAMSDEELTTYLIQAHVLGGALLALEFINTIKVN